MRTLTKPIYYKSRRDSVRLWHLTDLHLGARACDEARLQRDISAIEADPNAYWIGGGDYIDAICQVGDRRYRPSSLARWALGEDDVMGTQVNYAAAMLKPIAHKCLGLVDGNHEAAAVTWYGRNVYWSLVEKIALEAGVQPESLALGVQGFLKLKFRRGTPGSYGSTWTMNIYLHHGYGGGKLAGGHALALERAMGTYNADLILMGHRHVRVFTDKLQIGPDPVRGCSEKYRAAAFTPSYLRAHIEPSHRGCPVDTYAERAGYFPKDLGTLPITVIPNKGKFYVSQGSAEAADLMEAVG